MARAVNCLDRRKTAHVGSGLQDFEVAEYEVLAVKYLAHSFNLLPNYFKLEYENLLVPTAHKQGLVFPILLCA